MSIITDTKTITRNTLEKKLGKMENQSRKKMLLIKLLLLLDLWANCRLFSRLSIIKVSMSTHCLKKDFLSMLWTTKMIRMVWQKLRLMMIQTQIMNKISLGLVKSWQLNRKPPSRRSLSNLKLKVRMSLIKQEPSDFQIA